MFRMRRSLRIKNEIVCKFPGPFKNRGLEMSCWRPSYNTVYSVRRCIALRILNSILESVSSEGTAYVISGKIKFLSTIV
jgi:hypothetical protein